ncbi:rab11 family-interacting protein 4 [Zerene cesonia]|uniref:rab11 family-interacting protein 4 n=1 Tax=Zerene cesonia TaxID=33412 RepID=UPI0018E58B1B|nr:rab11 family-interacting protein 4 [Zerene cesonia]
MTSMSKVVVFLREAEGTEVDGVLDTWWRGLVLLAKLLGICYQLLYRIVYESKVPVAVMMAPSVFQRTKSPRSSPGNHARKLQNGTEASQAENTADSSPGNSISDAENFECYGEADGDAPNNTTENGSRSPGNPLNRHSWTRTSLRRTPPSHQENLPHRRWGSMRHSGKRQIGSNVLASQLYRSSSFNSSGCGSGGEPADDMYSDVSLEEDVQGLNYKVQLLQQQVTSLADTQSTADERYARAKADNAVLQARVHMLDEQIREIECRCEERIAEEQKRCREAIARVERDRDAQLAAQQELRALSAAPPPPPDPRLDELRQELALLRTQNKSLTEAQEELQAQILTRGVEEGRSLLDGVSGPLVATNSLAHELSQMSDHELVGSEQTDHSIELEKLQKALKEQQDVNVQLRNYIDGILLSIVENYPQLLEVKYQKPDIKS